MRSRRTRVAFGVLALMVLGTFAAASAGAADVGVTLSTGGGSRVLSLRDIADSADLESIDFGDVHAAPFLVKVTDTTFDRDSFTVSAQMTNFYKFVDGAWTIGYVIPSANLNISSPNDLEVSDISAIVQPLLDITLNVPDGALCTSLTVLSVPCTIDLSDVTADALEIVPSDLTNLAGLPLVPGDPETGPFTVPAYTVDSPDTPGTPPAATSLDLLTGNPNMAAPYLTALTTAVQDVVDGAAGITDVVSQTTLIAALEGAFPALTPLLESQIVAAAGAVSTVENIVAGQILSQSGQYRSYPVLNVTVPEGADQATYKGTLVVTGIG